MAGRPIRVGGETLLPPALERRRPRRLRIAGFPVREPAITIFRRERSVDSLEQLLEESVALHGHKCPGQVLGVRLAMEGCRAVDVTDPKGSKKLIVYVEIDRCATDAIQSATGCKLGKRTLKYLDYGKLAATFLNTETSRAVRVVARDDSREKVNAYAPEATNKAEAQLQAYTVMPVEELFTFQEVKVKLSEEDAPGRPKKRVFCQQCGEGINDKREVDLNGQIHCRSCAYGGYYQPVETAAAAGR